MEFSKNVMILFLSVLLIISISFCYTSYNIYKKSEKELIKNIDDRIILEKKIDSIELINSKLKNKLDSTVLKISDIIIYNNIENESINYR